MVFEKNKSARAIMANAQKEEFKHFGMALEFLLRQKKDWRDILNEFLFTTGDIVKAGKKAEKLPTRLADHSAFKFSACTIGAHFFNSFWM